MIYVPKTFEEVVFKFVSSAKCIPEKNIRLF